MSVFPFSKAGILLTGDEKLVIGPPLDSLVTRFAPTVDVAPTGTDLVLRVQNQTGASPSGFIEATILAGATVATPVSGSFAVLAGASVYVRVVSGPSGGSAASFLGGYFETAGAEGGGAFCTVGQVKAAAGVLVATYDADLALIVANVTGAMQKYLQRDIVSTSYTAETHSLGQARTKLVLDNRPIISVMQVRLDGAVVATADYDVLESRGILYNETGWAAGEYHIEVDYTAGYATLPPALVGACIEQSRYLWSQHAQGGNRFGHASRSEGGGGSSAFIVDDWQPGVLSVLKSYRRAI